MNTYDSMMNNWQKWMEANIAIIVNGDESAKANIHEYNVNFCKHAGDYVNCLEADRRAAIKAESQRNGRNQSIIETLVGQMEMGTFKSQSSNYLTPVEQEAKKVFEARQAAHKAKEDAERAVESDLDKFIRMCDCIVNRFNASQKATGYSYYGVADNAERAFEIMFA